MSEYHKLIAEFQAARGSVEYSQGYIEEVLGTTGKQLNKWEQFARRPTLFNAVCWAQVLGYELRLVKVRDVQKAKKKTEARRKSIQSNQDDCRWS